MIEESLKIGEIWTERWQDHIIIFLVLGPSPSPNNKEDTMSALVLYCPDNFAWRSRTGLVTWIWKTPAYWNKKLL